MFEITGRLFTINVVSEKSLQVVIKKTIMGKLSPISFNVFGTAKYNFDKQKFNTNDKVVIKCFPKSTLYNGKWYTELCLLDINLWVKKPKYDPYNPHGLPTKTEAQKPDLFRDDNDYINGIGGGHIIDEETGEILL